MAAQPQPSLRGQTALVTGASRGIGRAIAIAFAEAGASVALLARSTDVAPGRLRGTLDETALQVEAAGARALPLAADVRREEQVQAAVQRALEAFGRVDILVNNAAVFFGAPFHELPLTRWDLVLDVNLRGAAVCTRAVAPAMIAQGSGRIINVSSSLAAELYPEMSAYAASKAGLEMLTSYLALELSPHGIAANVLRVDRAVATEGALLVNPQAGGPNWSAPEEAAAAALWLAAEPLSYTGHVVLMSDISAKS